MVCDFTITTAIIVSKLFIAHLLMGDLKRQEHAPSSVETLPSSVEIPTQIFNCDDINYGSEGALQSLARETDCSI